MEIISLNVWINDNRVKISGISNPIQNNAALILLGV
jgi:hypothetical protein